MRHPSVSGHVGVQGSVQSQKRVSVVGELRLLRERSISTRRRGAHSRKVLPRTDRPQDGSSRPVVLIPVHAGVARQQLPRRDLRSLVGYRNGWTVWLGVLQDATEVLQGADVSERH